MTSRNKVVRNKDFFSKPWGLRALWLGLSEKQRELLNPKPVLRSFSKKNIVSIEMFKPWPAIAVRIEVDHV